MTTWIKLAPATQDDVSGMYITWTQYTSDKITIKIDDGTDTFPWKLDKISNDGHEFLPNVSSWQNIKIKAYNGCARADDYSPSVSHDTYPNGWYNE
ncbi:MAG: hypothetical protein CO141_03245 [Candidatus Moranbacteria bacterium CG_4_9_14_3_um_filter_42_9]|nr:MAG: hypothetical protein CO141_03245 [Candidatus Moranbacteria bacterium CG_4_9_14_3_um_filter_42_9]